MFDAGSGVILEQQVTGTAQKDERVVFAMARYFSTGRSGSRPAVEAVNQIDRVARHSRSSRLLDLGAVHE